ncbi:terpenoid cyclases/Protein prenyltransferase [Microstroma glucosiphilum]|uniref:Terpenoid cyclases/Protein prenyltransferase n=1 Tax=Pseudomicrostroma glucosiphilum TaxID=1684307 RepID=A0A316U280_9BASI|nr:terpenoid cyclases/Protein prenyltransferase [Pseudomicrostroma glucosiphilum]PWN18591.1 terpenoid cyclases/Protein prenyltransferase [Pseudomicrostroma glucosiphilum]
MASTSCVPTATLEVKRHRAFFKRHIQLLPRPYTSGDSQRMTLAFFCLSGLDLLGGITESGAGEAESFREWIWSQQMPHGGFRGSPAVEEPSKSNTKTSAHLAMTYTALLNLAILRDDFSRLNTEGLIDFVASCQQPDGSFSPSPGLTECDPRFTFCAFSILSMLSSPSSSSSSSSSSWSRIDVPRALHFLARCKSYDGAYGQGPHQESHGGSTYCVLASYKLAGRLEELGKRERGRIVRWLLARQSDWEADLGAVEEDEDEDEEEEGEQEEQHKQELGLFGGGFNGRIGKKKDACYSFWCGASLAILSSHHLINSRHNLHHLLALQSPIGGIRKTADDPPDAMHSYLGLAACALLKGEALGRQEGVEEGEGNGEEHERMEKKDEKQEQEQEHQQVSYALEGLATAGLDPCLNISLETRDWIVQKLGSGREVR